MKQETSVQGNHEIAPAPSHIVLEHQEGDKMTNEYAGTQAIYVDEKTNRELFWVVNRRILACMLGTYFCQSLDKGTLGWLGTILYMGVLVGEYPTNLLLQKLPVAKYLAVNVFCWGIVIACSAAATNFPALMVVRFLLGVFESCVQPAFIIMLESSSWYALPFDTQIQPARLTEPSQVGGIIAWGASHYNGHDIKSWQLLFLVLGVATCAWGLFIGWWLPDSPMAAKCFNEDQKRLMIERVRANETGIQNKTYKRYQMIETITDPVIWCYVMLQITSTLIIGGLGVFSNLIISSFGFTYLQTQLLNIAQVRRWRRGRSRLPGLCIPAIIGTAVIYSIPPSATNRIGLLIAFYCTQFYLAEGNLIFSLISRNVAGQTKKSTTLAMTFIGWAAGNMTAPQIFQAGDAPRYRKGFTAHFCLYVLFNAFLVLLRFLLVRRNLGKRKAAAAAAEEISEDDGKGGKTPTFDTTFKKLRQQVLYGTLRESTATRDSISWMRNFMTDTKVLVTLASSHSN
ncbi:allantoate permease [Colletotrichum tofieldiae]|uniref:Allantoate permease n=1 Tax=Colletotrichum tofieldiae TaxID=708197 RepID=A0A166MWA7_9PEZI|nr:allantoate permease [Colletotrichum tofieldiae]